MSRDATSEAETLRQQIKDIIAEADEGNNDVDRLQSRDGRITYVGSSLGTAVGALMERLKINSEVWGYTVWHFPKDLPLKNVKRNMQVVSLADNSTITITNESTTPDPLTNFLTKVTHKTPVIGSGSTVIVFLEYDIGHDY
ncbi:hypothetical protein BDV12DRAFT_172190 [Aspergillus spectabilis]